MSKDKKKYETTPLQAFEQSLASKRQQAETKQKLEDINKNTSFAPEGLIQRLKDQLLRGY